MPLDRLYWWLTISTVFVIIGVVLEGEEILVEIRENGLKHVKHLWAKIGFVLLVIGLCGELIFQTKIESADSELKIKSDIQIAGATDKAARVNERAAQLEKEAARLSVEAETAKSEIASANAREKEAELALEQLKRPRFLLPDQQATLIEELKSYKGTRFDMSLIPGDPEAYGLLAQISDVLVSAGWEWTDFASKSGPLTLTFDIHGKPNVGQSGWWGVIVAMDAENLSAERPASTALMLGLRSRNILAWLHEDAAHLSNIPNHDAIHIIVGRKPI